MKHTATLVLLFTIAFAFAVNAAPVNPAAIKPDKPKIGDRITITYNGAVKGAVLAADKQITVNVLAARDNDTPVLTELQMKKKGKVWTAVYNLSEKAATALFITFVGDEKEDNNNKDCLRCMIYDAKKKPVKGARNSMALALARGSAGQSFYVKADQAAAAKLIEEEKKVRPDNWVNASFVNLQLLARDAKTEEGKRILTMEIDQIYEGNQENDDVLVRLLPWIERYSAKGRLEQIIIDRTTSSPQGKFSFAVECRNARNEKDMDMRVKKLELALNNFPDVDAKSRESAEQLLISALIKTKAYNRAVEIADRAGIKDGTVYNEIAWPMIEQGEQLEDAVKLASKSVDMLRNPDESLRERNIPRKTWEAGNRSALSASLDTWGCGLMKLGRSKEAEPLLAEAVKLSENENPDIIVRYVECLLAVKKSNEALNTLSECIRKNKADKSITDLFSKVWISAKGSDKGCDNALNDLKMEAKKSMREKIAKEMVRKPAPSFTLKAMDGSMVSLASLKGKVVVVDFWATWCGPCKMSFPTLQKMWDKYKSNPDVRILAIDTWENLTGDKREEAVRKFISDNKYTFTVLYDDDYVTKYEVQGVPTKFFIGRDGNIRYVSIGFESAQIMTDEMEMLFEMLLAEK